MSHPDRKDLFCELKSFISKAQPIDQERFYHAGEATMHFMAIQGAFLLVTFATTASTEQATAAPESQISRPQPFCLEESFYPSASYAECSRLVNLLPFNPFAIETVTWGGFFMPGRLPQLISKSDRCAIKLRPSRYYAHPDRFRLLDFRGSLIDVVSQCTGSSSPKGKGGFILVGTKGMINAWVFGITDNPAPGLGNDSSSIEVV
ncbi:MAG: hypothetical protein Q9167_005501 [Letrouitia subvulpina]